MYHQKRLLDQYKRSESQGSFPPGAALLLHGLAAPKRASDAEAQQISIRCPQCSHRFRLLDSLAVAAVAAASPETRTATQSTCASVSSEQAGNSGDSKPQSSKPILTQKQQEANPSTKAYLKHTTSSTSASPPPNSPPPPADQLTSDVVRNYQITNTSIEQLERVIMDKADRRIRKIAARSGCNIDLRSELPAGRFGVAKNYCVLRARAETNLESCRCMLVRQMGWNLAVRLA